MLSMAQTSHYIVSKAELAIGVEAARPEPGFLTSALDLSPVLSVEEQIRPWQEVVAAIFQAQNPQQYDIEEQWSYWKLSPRQDAHFDKIWHLASKRQDPDPFGEKHAARQAKLEFSPLESACLGFCLSLLNQRALDDVEECAMVKVLAVLGWGRNYWKAPDEYMVTLSHLIQTARWMVVARSLELANDRDVFIRKWNEGTFPIWMIEDPLNDIEFDRGLDDEFIRRRQERKANQKGRSFLEWVEVMTQAFMTRRTIGPMQWMLQLWVDGSRFLRTSTSTGQSSRVQGQRG